jgi:hypothetical protein
MAFSLHDFGSIPAHGGRADAESLHSMGTPGRKVSLFSKKTALQKETLQRAERKLTIDVAERTLSVIAEVLDSSAKLRASKREKKQSAIAGKLSNNIFFAVMSILFILGSAATIAFVWIKDFDRYLPGCSDVVLAVCLLALPVLY